MCGNGWNIVILWQVRKGRPSGLSEEAFIVFFCLCIYACMVLTKCIKNTIFLSVFALMLTLQKEREVYVSV